MGWSLSADRGKSLAGSIGVAGINLLGSVLGPHRSLRCRPSEIATLFGLIGFGSRSGLKTTSIHFCLLG